VSPSTSRDLDPGGPADLVIRRLDDAEVERVTAVLGLARLHQGDGYYLVAWLDDEPVGHAYLALSDPPEMQDVSVRDEFRGRGLARRLVDAVEADAVDHGADALRLTVSAENARVQSLYRSLGFNECGVAPRRVTGTVMIRTGPLVVDDTLLTWQKDLRAAPRSG
jgi:GNAT superfamily N-acetyltransferase